MFEDLARPTGGGFVAAAYGLVSILAPEWNDLLPVCEPYDVRNTDTVDILARDGTVTESVVDPPTGTQFTTLTWYTVGCTP